MKGCNAITLCPAEMMEAMQEWLNKRMPENESNVVKVEQTRINNESSFVINLVGECEE